MIEGQRFQENRPDDGEQRDSRPHANGNHYDDGSVAGRLIVFRREATSDAGLDTERGEKVPGRDGCTDLFGPRTSFREVVQLEVVIKRKIGASGWHSGCNENTSCG